MYPNLEAEKSRNKVTNKDIARVLGIDASTVSAKLNSYDRLKFSEAKAIRDNFFPTLQVEYLLITKPHKPKNQYHIT